MDESGDQSRAATGGKPCNKTSSLNAQMKQAKQYEREFQKLSKIKDVQGMRNYAATKIQANFRRHKEGREALALKRRFTRNAQRIQRYWKKYVVGNNNGKDDEATEATVGAQS